MQTILRYLPLLIGAVFALSSIQWIVDPEAAAGSLGMDLLTGAGASTQIGDIGAFFVCVAAMIGLGQRQGHSQWLLGAAMLLGTAAVMRTLAWLAGHADFAVDMVAPEVLFAAILWAAARARADEAASAAA